MASLKISDRASSAEAQQLVAQFQDPLLGAQRLKDIALFARFTNEELAQIYATGKLVALKPQANAVVEGEPSQGMFIILEGHVSVYKTDAVTGSLVRLAILDEGSPFGEISLFDRAPRSATVVAETHCYLFQLDAEDFNRFLNQAGVDVQVRFYKTCAEDLAERFRALNSDYLHSQRLLWKYALRRGDDAAPALPAQKATPKL